MKRPKLLIVSFSTIASDARVLKQVREFASTHKVVTVGFGPSPHPDVEHLSVDPEFAPTLATTIGDHLNPHLTKMGKFGTAYRQLPWVRHALELLAGRRFDAAIANDVDTAAIALAVTRHKQVHVDLHEFFPGVPDGATKESRRQVRYYEWLIRRYVSRAASWSTVASGIAEEYRAYGLTCDVVTNATPYLEAQPTEVASPIRIVHSGNAQPERDLEVTMRAVATSSANVTLDLYLMPNDTAYLEALRVLAVELGDRVRVLDPVPQAELVSTLHGYDVGIFFLPPSSANNKFTLPNKFFDYVQARLGVLIGPSEEMVSILTRYDFGAVANGFDEAAIRDSVDALTPEQIMRWKRAAHDSARALSAEHEVTTWRQAIERLAPSHRAQP